MVFFCYNELPTRIQLDNFTIYNITHSVHSLISEHMIQRRENIDHGDDVIVMCAAVYSNRLNSTNISPTRQE